MDIPALTVSDDGWVTVILDDRHNMHLKFGESVGTIGLVGVYLHGNGITPGYIRGIPLSRIEAALTIATGGLVSDDPPVDLREAAELPEPSLATLRGRAVTLREQVQPDRTAAQRPPLSRPIGSFPQDFYQQVAVAYAEYAPRTRAPAKAIAMEAGVPITTVHRWVREARRLGHLPPGRKGKVG